MNVSKTVLDALASPPTALLIAVVLLLAGLRSRFLRTPAQGRKPPVQGRPGAPRRALILAVVAVAAVVAAALLDDPPPDVPADPAALEGAAPAWFLVPFAQAARVFEPAVAWIALPLLLLAALVAVPFLDVSLLDGGDEPTPGVRGFGLFAFLIVFLVPMAIGGLLPERPLPPGAAPLAVRFWEDLLDQSPRSAVVRELPGLVLIAFALVFLPWFLPRWRPTRNVFGRLHQRLGTARYALATTLAVLLVAVPVKVWARWWLGIG